MKANFDAVFFDFDGTVADTGEGIFASVNYAVESLGYEPLSDEMLRTFIGPPVFESFRRMLGADDETAALAVKKYREYYAEKGIFNLRVYDGITELFDEIKKSGIKLAIASSKPENFVKRIIDRLDLSGIIDFVSAPESDKAPESKVALVEKAIAHFGVDKSRALMVGDRFFDVDGAKGAGIECVGVTFGYGSKDELKKAGADYLADSAEDIRRIIFS